VLGLHRRHTHGVISPAKLKAQAVAEKKQQLALTERTQSVNDKISSPSSRGEGGENAASSPSFDPIAYALAIGSLKEFCRHFAEEHGIPTRDFTRQCAELFLREARR
jgi:hypothetical protein